MCALLGGVGWTVPARALHALTGAGMLKAGSTMSPEIVAWRLGDLTHGWRAAARDPRVSDASSYAIDRRPC